MISYIDYSLSNRIIESSIQKIECGYHGFIQKLQHDLQEVPLIEEKINLVQRDLRKCFDSECRLVPIGSAANLLLNQASDLDLVLLPYNNAKLFKSFKEKFARDEQFKKSYMKKTRSQIMSRNIGFCDHPYFTAKIPILRFFSKRKLQVDIQFGNIGPIRSSLFVRTCVEYDERVGFLIHWLTNKFQEAGILNSADGKFSRYHVNILVIHFLQAIPYPVLPDIIQLSPWLSPKHDWNNAVKVLTRRGSLYVPNNSEMPNKHSVGALAVQLVDYYSQVDFQRVSIDTRGRLLDRTESDSSQLKLIDEFFDQSTCRVSNAPPLLKALFIRLKALVLKEKYDDLFKYYKLKQHR